MLLYARGCFCTYTGGVRKALEDRVWSVLPGKASGGRADAAGADAQMNRHVEQTTLTVLK
jgi:hypothetical protein